MTVNRLGIENLTHMGMPPVELVRVVAANGCTGISGALGPMPLAMFGALLFSTNFLCFYHATLYIPSGLSAVIFASASIFNGLNLWLFEGKRPGLRWLQGSLLGLLGTLLLFWPVLADAQLGANGWKDDTLTEKVKTRIHG